MMSPTNIDNQVDDELKDMLFAQHQSGGSIDIIVTSDTKTEHVVPVTESDILQHPSDKPYDAHVDNGQTTGRDGTAIGGYELQADSDTTGNPIDPKDAIDGSK